MANINVNAVIGAEDKASKVISGVGNSIGKMAKRAGLAMTAAGVGLTAIAKKSSDFTTQLVKDTKLLSRETGISAKESSRLLFVTNRLGISADEASLMFGRFSKSIVNSSKGNLEHAKKSQKLSLEIEKTRLQIEKITKQIEKHGDKTGLLTNHIKELKLKLSDLKGKMEESTGTFEKLGISIKNADGNLKPFNTILLETADKFKKMRDGPEKTAIAMDLFGRSGKDMIKVLNLGKEGIENLENSADKLGMTLTQDNISAVSKYIESQKKLQDSTNALKLTVGTLTTPVLTKLNEKLNSTVTRLLEGDGAVKKATVGILAFGGPILTAAGSTTTFLGTIAQISPKLGPVISKLGLWGVSLTAGVAITGALSYKLTEINTKFGIFSMQASVARGVMSTLLGPTGNFINILSTLGGVLFKNSFATKQLQYATADLTAAQLEAKSATEQYKNSGLQLEGALLSQKRAQLQYKTAIKMFGKDSLDAKEALYNLKVANENVKTATDNNKQSHEKYTNAIKKTKDIEKLTGTMWGLKNGLMGASDAAMIALDSVNSFLKAGKGVPAYRLSPGAPGLACGPKKNAAGTDYCRGGATIVGERGPEMVSLPRGSKIHRADETARMGGVTQYNISVQAGAFMGSQQDARRYAQVIADALKDIASMKGTTVGSMLA